MSRHTIELPPSEYLPAGHFVHPSVAFYAPVLVAILPAGHSCGEHAITEPPADYNPTAHNSQPSVVVVALTKVLYLPPGHC